MFSVHMVQKNALQYKLKTKGVSKMKKLLIGILVLLMLFGVSSAMSKKMHHSDMHQHPQMVEETDQSNLATCPVMGTTFPKDKAYEVVEYKGEKYYMCCAGCGPAFKKDPEKYIKK